MRAGMEAARKADFSATLIRGDFSKNPEFLPTYLRMRAGRSGPVSKDSTEMRQCKLGEPCWLATVLRPNICAMSPKIASRIISPFGSGVYQAKDLVRYVEEWRQDTTLKFASSSHPW